MKIIVLKFNQTLKQIMDNSLDPEKNTQGNPKDKVCITSDGFAMIDRDLENIVDIKIIPSKPIEIFDNWDTLLLAGGSVKGISTLGAIQWLLDKNYLEGIKNYIGTSIGSLVCYLVIIGYTPIEIMAYLCSKKITEKMSCIDINSGMAGKGAVSFNIIQEEIEKMTLNKLGTLMTMRELYNMFGKKLVCTVYNLTKSRTEYISEDNYPNIPCITAIKMSCSLPILFEEVEYMNSYYVDGGIGNNFPLEYAKSIGKYIIGININTVSSFKPMSQISMLDYLGQYIKIAFSVKNIEFDSRMHKIINLNPTDFKFFNFNVSTRDKLELFSMGYNQISQQF